MIRKFLKRCFFAGMMIAVIAIGTVACCYFLACSPPNYYAAALAKPIDAADVEAASEEMERIVSSMELFIRLDAAELEQLKAMPAQALATTEVGTRKTKVSLSEALKTLERSQGVAQDTYAITLTERHLNAWLIKELGTQDRDFRRPYISLQDDMIRFAVTLVTPAGEVALSSDFRLAKTSQTNLTFELHAASIGRLPVPATTILKQYMQTNPRLPQGVVLNVEGERPTLTITAMPDDGVLQLDEAKVANSEVQLTFRRTDDIVVAANH